VEERNFSFLSTFFFSIDFVLGASVNLSSGAELRSLSMEFHSIYNKKGRNDERWAREREKGTFFAMCLPLFIFYSTDNPL
jgi:hypothetical protein